VTEADVVATAIAFKEALRGIGALVIDYMRRAARRTGR